MVKAQNPQTQNCSDVTIWISVLHTLDCIRQILLVTQTLSSRECNICSISSLLFFPQQRTKIGSWYVFNNFSQLQISSFIIRQSEGLVFLLIKLWIKSNPFMFPVICPLQMPADIMKYNGIPRQLQGGKHFSSTESELNIRNFSPCICTYCYMQLLPCEVEMMY